MTLGAHDYRTIEAATGAEALSALRHHRPDLVLLDLGLPDIDGLALIAPIRETDRCRSSCCRAAATRRPRWRRSTPAPTTMSPSRSAPTS